jgi:hypothetical protein
VAVRAAHGEARGALQGNPHPRLPRPPHSSLLLIHRFSLTLFPLGIDWLCQRFQGHLSGEK